MYAPEYPVFARIETVLPSMIERENTSLGAKILEITSLEFAGERYKVYVIPGEREMSDSSLLTTIRFEGRVVVNLHDFRLGLSLTE